MTLVRVKPPYAESQTDPEKSIHDINQLLRKYGVSNYQWTTLYDAGHVSLRMVLEDPEGKLVQVLVRAPPMLAERKTYDSKLGKHVKQRLPNWSQSLRLMHHYVKSKLEAVTWGLREVREEFLADVVVKDRSGRETTVGEVYQNALTSGGYTLPQLGPPGRTEPEKSGKPASEASFEVLS